MLTLDDIFISSQQLELKFIITHNFVTHTVIVPFVMI